MIYNLIENLTVKENDYKYLTFPANTTGLSYMETYKSPFSKEIHLALVVVAKDTNQQVHTLSFKIYKDEEYDFIVSIFNSDGTLTPEGLNWALENIKVNDVPLEDIIIVD